MAEIFLYTKAAGINSMHLKALRKAGFITVGVNNLDEVRQLQPVIQMPRANLGLIFEAALRAVRSSGDMTRRKFGDEIADAVIASGIEARSDATGTGAAEGESPARSEAKGDAP